MKKKLTIATRQSPLALWQANFIKAALNKLWPSLEIDLLPLTTSGDTFLKDRLQAVGSKGLFVKELEEALLDGRADIAVHSMKDVPAMQPEGLSLPVICKRHSPFDALVSQRYTLDTLPKDAIIVTSSLRRQAQLSRLKPDVTIKLLRGNIHTRLDKLAANDFDAIILAEAGLERMGINVPYQSLNAQQMLPACGQGALTIECRANDDKTLALIQPLNDESTALSVKTERIINAALGGNCHVPVAIYAQITLDDKLSIEAKVFDIHGKKTCHTTQLGELTQYKALAKAAADHLIAEGAMTLLNAH